MCMPPFMIADDATSCERKCQIDASLQKTAHHQLPTKHLCSFLNLFLFNLIIVANAVLPFKSSNLFPLQGVMYRARKECLYVVG